MSITQRTRSAILHTRGALNSNNWEIFFFLRDTTKMLFLTLSIKETRFAPKLLLQLSTFSLNTLVQIVRKNTI